jgi:osmotically-inducible protein OsmY
MAQDEPDVYVTEHLREALAKDPRVNELELEVSLAGGKLFVSGTVSTEARRRAVTEVLAELAPDREVVNQTSVLSVSPKPEAERIG